MKSQLFSLSSRRRLTPIQALLLAFGMVAGFFMSVPAAVAEEREEAGVTAVIRLPPPKALSEKILAVARQIQPGPQTEALPFILGGMLGDPMLEGVSPTENMGVALLSRGDENFPVFILHLPEESPLRQSLSSFNIQLQDHGGWSFALPEDQSFAVLEGNRDALIRAVRAPRRQDLEISFNIAQLGEKLRNAFLNEVAPNLEEGFGGFIQPLVSVLAAEADALKDFRIGLDVSREQLEQSYYLEAAEGTPFASFLSQRRPQDLSFARFIEADGGLAYLGGIDVAAAQAYLDHFASRLAAEDDEGMQAWSNTLQEIGTRYLQATDGAMAGVMTLQGLQYNVKQIAPSTLTDKELVKLLEETVQGLGATAEAMKEDEPRLVPHYELFVNEVQIDGTPVHILRTEQKLDPEHAQELEQQIPGFTLPAQRQEMHYALAGGFMLTASEVTGLSEMLEAVKTDKPVENNLAGLIDVEEGDLFEVRVDLLRYVGGAMAPFMTPELAVVMEDLEKRGLQPVSATVSARDGEGALKVVIPVDTLVGVYQTVTSFMAQQQAKEEAEGVEPFGAEQP